MKARAPRTVNARDPDPRPRRVRIIGGIWKRTPLPVPEVDGLRPSPDRIRETLFNWLGQDLSGRHCLDLFAGSGALGLEAASRGAAAVVMVERDRRAAASIRATMAKLGATQTELLESDALAALDGLQRRSRRFDLVFLDPPFGQNWLARVMPHLPSVLRPDARVYVESEVALAAADLARWLAQPVIAAENGPVALKTAKAGKVHYHLFQIARPGPGEP